MVATFLAVKVLFAVVLVALAVGTGCGSRGEEAKGTTTAQRTKDAASMLLKQSDLPDGWTVVRAFEPAWFGNCVGVIYGGAPRIGEASAMGESEGTYAEVFSAATVFGSESEASESFRAAATRMEGSQSAGASSCVADWAEIDTERFGEPGDVHELSVVASANVDEAKRWRIGLHLDEYGTAHDVPLLPESSTSLDWLVLRQGETIVELFTFDETGPFDPDLRDQLMKTLVGRLARNASE